MATWTACAKRQAGRTAVMTSTRRRKSVSLKQPAAKPQHSVPHKRQSRRGGASMSSTTDALPHDVLLLIFHQLGFPHRFNAAAGDRWLLFEATNAPVMYNGFARHKCGITWHGCCSLPSVAQHRRIGLFHTPRHRLNQQCHPESTARRYTHHPQRIL